MSSDTSRSRTHTRSGHRIRWIRLYHSLLDHQRTASLPATQLGHYIRILLAASSHGDPPGRVPDISILRRYLGPYLADRPAHIQRIIDDLVSHGLIDRIVSTDDHGSHDIYMIHGFSRRQFRQIQKIESKCPKMDTDDVTDDVTVRSSVRNDANKGLTDRVDVADALLLSSVDFLSSIHDNIYYLCTTICRDRDAIRERIPDSGLEACWSAWQSSPGTIHHHALTDTDRRAYRRAIDDGVSSECIQIAISRYSLWIAGSRETPPRYRVPYRWTFADFVSRRHHELVSRLNAVNWEDSCMPWSTGRVRADRSVDSLLRAADTLSESDDG